MSLSRTSLAAAIDIPAWLEQDRQNSWKARIKRDQEISNQSGIDPSQETKRLLHWWSKIQPVRDEQSTGKQLTTLFKRVSWVAIIIGFIAGVVLATSLLHYDGSQPINVLVLLLVLVLIPLLLFLLSLLIPIFSSSSLISTLNVGSQAMAFFRRKSPVLQAFFSSSRSDQARDRILRWRFLLSSQQFGIALAVAALLVLIAKVSFSDLAFGWSTTLDFHSSSLTPWVQALALPWSAWLPEAVPTNQLIEQSRFFRLENGVRELSAETLTGWWKFIAMCLLVYGIGFRILAVWFANINFKKATREMLMQHSEVTALLDRFNVSPSMQEEAQIVRAKNHAVQNPESFDFQSADIVIRWNHANIFGNNIQHENVIEVASEDVLQLENELFKELDKKNIKHIHIISKAWEPPLLEFHDLIHMLRNEFGNNVSISVQPAAANEKEPDTVDVEIWRHSIEKLQDAKVYVV